MKAVTNRTSRANTAKLAKRPRTDKSDAQKPTPINLTGQFLIAMPNAANDAFERAVIYVCEHTERGALGLMINRPADVMVSEVLAKMASEDNSIRYSEISGKVDQNVLVGGPVQTERGFVLHSPYREYAATIKINDNLGLTSSRDILEDWAQGQGPQKMLLALGYAGWGAGQLEEELSHNVWLNVAADEHVIFETLLTEKYSQAMRLLGINESMLISVSGHA